MTPTREEIRKAITSGQTRIAKLEAELSAERDRVAALESDLLSMPPVFGAVSQAMSPADKVRLFRSLFRGREDVYPRLWENAKTGKKGYAPVCRNEWRPGICEKPRIKCGECPHRAFVPVTDETIVGHLQGHHTIGVYPMMLDETCAFLAADFDKATWAEDVTAFSATCHQMGIPVGIERSRSGNGAHAWIFFRAPVSAAIARRMGCYVLTETMRRRRDLAFSSYDRFFPNQDTMPKGGFGNLIALPLQRVPRRSHNSVFVDDALVPHVDQWGFLSTLERMDPVKVEDIAREAARRGQIIGVRAADPDDDDSPWALPPQPRAPRVDCKFPKSIHGVLAQRLFVEKDGLPPPAINAIKRLASFQNPEFYKKQSLRLSTSQTPRVITCSEELASHLSLPRGCVSAVEEFARQHGCRFVLDDQRQVGLPLDLKFQGTLTQAQQEAAQAMLEADMGVFVAPPGVGKTVVGTWLIAERNVSTLVLVHRQPLAEQWIAQLSMFLGIPATDVGVMAGAKRKLNGRMDVAMLQSLSRMEEVASVVAGYGHVVVDECHHLPAASFERVLSSVRARHVTGLTATPKRRDGLQPIGEMQLGPVRHAIHPRSAAAKRPFELQLVECQTSFRASGDNPTITDIYGQIVADSRRTAAIAADVRGALAEGRWPLVVTQRKEHLHALVEAIGEIDVPVVILHGGMRGSKRKQIAKELAELSEKPRVLVAIGSYIGEGFDDPRLDTLFVAMPMSWRGTIEQYAGRLHRLHPNKTNVRIYDYVDSQVLVLARMADKRLRVYRALGYETGHFGQLDLPVPRN